MLMKEKMESLMMKINFTQMKEFFTFFYPSGMCISWRPEDPGKLMVAEKKGIVRLYNILTMQPLSSIICGAVPLTGMAWSLHSKLVVILAAGELLVKDMNLPS